VNRCAEERPAVDSHPGDSQNKPPGPVTGGPGFRGTRPQIPAGRSMSFLAVFGVIRLDIN